MATPAKNTTAPKKERKKPVRTAPAQKDYPTKLAWLKAMTEHEEAEATKANAAKVTRLDKRIASKQALVNKTEAEIDALKIERFKLVPEEEAEADVDGMTDDEHLAAEGKA